MKHIPKSNAFGAKTGSLSVTKYSRRAERIPEGRELSLPPLEPPKVKDKPERKRKVTPTILAFMLKHPDATHKQLVEMIFQVFGMRLSAGSVHLALSHYWRTI